MDFDEVDFMESIIRICSVPELKVDLDSEPIENRHFHSYHESLKLNLPTLYDFLQKQYVNKILNNNEPNYKSVRASLLVLLAELTSVKAIYKHNDVVMLNNANQFLQKYIHDANNEDIEQIIFTYYRKKLDKNCWKVNIGAVFGFVNFLEVANDSKEMSLQWMSFSLSIALTIRGCYDPIYKNLGLKILLLMLNSANAEQIQRLNIHGVVFDDVSKNVHSTEDVEATSDKWQCLLKCLEFFPIYNSLIWNYIDDMIEIIINDIIFTSNTEVHNILWHYLTKLLYFSSEDREEITLKLAEKWEGCTALEDLRLFVYNRTFYTSYRWARSILNLIISEAYRLEQSKYICRNLLMEMHQCYIIAILPIPLNIIHQHLSLFIEKFVTILLKVFVTHKKNNEIAKLIKDFIATFHWQLKSSSSSSSSCDCKEYNFSEIEIALSKLLNHEFSNINESDLCNEFQNITINTD